MIILNKTQLVTVKVEYYIPDYSHIINEFIWQTEDVWPQIPRIHNFLNFWRNNIEAAIHEIFLQKNNNSWKKADFIKDFN